MSEDNKNNNGQGLDEVLDTTGLVLDFLANWKWFVISVIILLIGAYFKIATIVPVYQVQASIYLNNENTQSKSAVTLNPESPLVAMKSYIDETELEILKSRNNVIDIVDSLDMAYSYWRTGNLRDIPLYEDKAFFAKLDSVSLAHLSAPITITIKESGKKGKYDIEASTVFNQTEERKTFDEATLPMDIELSQGTVNISLAPQISSFNGTQKVIIKNPKAIASALSSSLNIAFAENAPTIVRIAYNTPLPSQGVDVINTLVDFYNRQIIEDKNRSAIQTEAFILERLVMINDELRDVEQRLQEYRQAHNISDLSQQVSSSLQTQTSTENQLAEVGAQIRMIGEIENIVRQADDYTALPSVTSDNALNSIIEAYNKRTAQLTRMKETSSDDHPLVQSLKEELTRDKARILQNIASVKNGLQARRSNIAAIEGRSAGTLSSLPPIDKGLQEIFREQQVKVNIYTFLLQKREEIALQKTLATPTARLIDNPSESGPISPQKSAIYLVAFILGMALPAVFIFFRRLLFPIFKDQEELKRLTSVPIICEISTNPEKNAESIVVGTNVSTSIAELFRLLRNNIGFTKRGVDKKVILITSSVSGEGKTFIASNLAMTYALTGKRVVVVGLDIRRPALAHQFGFNNQQGVTTFLSGQVNDVTSLIHQSKESENLFILPAGPVPPNPNELLLSENMSRLMDQLRHDFDYVILDTAPIGIISDTFLIIRHSDIQLYITRASFSSKSNLKVLHQAIRDNRLPDAYIVLNGVDMAARGYTYRKYGHYQHGSKSSYGYGYSSDSKAKKK